MNIFTAKHIIKIYIANMHRISVFFLAAIILLRIIVMGYQSFEIDMSAWQAWAHRLYKVGFNNFYSNDIWTNYTPGYLIFLWMLGKISILFSIPIFSFTFELLVKIITTIFDLLTAFLIFKIVGTKVNSTWGKITAFFYIANPAIIFNTSVWGQVDGILTFFMLLSVYLMYEVKRSTISSLSFGWALLIKPQALIMFPVYFFTSIPLINIRSILLSTFFTLLLMITVSFLFFPSNNIYGLIQLILQMTKDYSFTSLYAFNLWAIVGWWQPDSIQWLTLTYQQWGIVVYTLLLSLILYITYTQRATKHFDSIVYFSFSLSILIFFLTLTRIHERYLFPFFAFFIIVVGLYKSRLLLSIYTILSGIHFINLWYVYFYYQFTYNNPTYQTFLPFQIITKTYAYLSLMSLLLLGVLILYFYLRSRSYE